MADRLQCIETEICWAAHALSKAVTSAFLNLMVHAELEGVQTAINGVDCVCGMQPSPGNQVNITAQASFSSIMQAISGH